MSKRARDGSLKLRFPIPDKELAGKRNILYYAAGFIMETYNFNPKANLVECRAAVEEGWRAFGMATFPDCIGDMMEELQTPRVQRLWADLTLQYSMYAHLTRSHPLPLQQVVSWPVGDVDRVAVLLGHPGIVLWVPMYGDTPAKWVEYSEMADGIRSLNPEVPITLHMVESILIHIFWNEYWGLPDDEIERVVATKLSDGRELYWKSESDAFPTTDDIPPQTVMIIPDVPNSYESFDMACHYLNPYSIVTREQVYQSFRWLLPLTTGLTGYPLVEALTGVLPTDMDHYHNAAKAFGLASSKHIQDEGGPPSTDPDKRLFSMTHQSHRMLRATDAGTVVPLARLPLPTAPAEQKRKDRIRAAFAHQYHLLNPGVKLTKANFEEAWRAMLDASLPEPAAGPEAAPEDLVAEKAPPRRAQRSPPVRRSRGAGGRCRGGAGGGLFEQLVADKHPQWAYEGAEAAGLEEDACCCCGCCCCCCW